jgi:hypothetical protein
VSDAMMDLHQHRLTRGPSGDRIPGLRQKLTWVHLKNHSQLFSPTAHNTVTLPPLRPLTNNMAWQLKKQVDRLEREVEQLKAKFNPPPPPPRKDGEESAGVSIYSIGVSANRLHGFGRFQALGRMALS